MLEQGCDFDALDIADRPPLFYAIKTKNINGIKLLLLNQASPWSCKNHDYYKMIGDDHVIHKVIKKARYYWIANKLHKALFNVR